MQLSESAYVDTWIFNYGYQLSFVTIIWGIGLFFSAIAPIIPCICFLYFFLKYWIDKYNLMYVYPVEFDS
jgi:hypothetical protein